MVKQESKRTIVQRKNLEKKIEKKDVLDYFLAGLTKAEIAEKVGCTVEAVIHTLDEVEHHVTAEISSVAEQLVLRNLARTERLIAIHYLLAIEHKDRVATKTVLDLMRFENELLSKMGIGEESKNDRSGVHIDEINLTINGHSDLYKIANTQISDDWLSRMQPDPENMLTLPENTPPSETELDQKLSEFERKHEQSED